MIRLEHVSVFYGTSQVLFDLNVSFGPASFTSIIGVNGCGKSTLLKAIAGLHPYQGNIDLNGKELRQYNRKDRAKMLAYLPQDRQIPHMDVFTMVAHGRFPHLGFSKILTSQDYLHIENAIHLTHIQNLLDRRISELSGGERQRVYLAMAIAQDADMVLLDEPTTYLDIRYQLETIEILKQMNQNGKSILMIVHDLQQAFAFADTVCLLHEGRILARESPQTLSQSRSLQEIFNVLVVPAGQENTQQLYTYQLGKRS